MDSISTTRLAAFLAEAKRRTYAGLDDDATVSTPGSKQLEYREGDLSYRDIYFGMNRFVGQEVVQAGERVIWAMSYAGGLSSGPADRSDALAIYAFLRKGLLALPPELPFRGPPRFGEGEFRYVNAIDGNLTEFHGEEQIFRAGTKVYGLRYGGGMIR